MLRFLLFLLLKSNVLFSQAKFRSIELTIGSRLQRNILLIQSPILISVGKDFFFEKLILSPFIKTESNFKKIFTAGFGTRLCLTDNYYPQNIYPIMSFYVPFQNTYHKNLQNLGPISTGLGFGYVANKRSKIETEIGFSENWKPFMNIECRINLSYKTKIKRKHLTKCPD
jgi:hypothetical protein